MMWLVAAELILNGVLAPLLVTALLFGTAYLADRDGFTALAPAIAITLAVCISGLVSFGWPLGLTFNARTKIMVSSIIGLALGVAFERDVRGSRVLLALGLTGIAIWLGLPALRQDLWQDGLLLIPVITGLLILASSRQSSGEAGLLIAVSVALGLAVIAALAKALSYSVFALALASPLLAALATGRPQLPLSAVITVGTTMLALLAALLLYTEVSLPALLVLSLCLGAEHLAKLTWRHGGRPPRRHILPYCLGPTLLAILIARIDGGAISIY
jgi:hypothetical protein